MARGRNTGSETLELQIERAQEKVVRTGAAYNKALETLQKLLDKRDAFRKDEIWNAVIRSDKSYEEIIRLIAGADGAGA